MARRYYQLPPLTTLAVFEAAARHQSIKRAATELNVTPGAVSHQIKTLESELGVPMFVRVHRGIELTPQGSDLFGVLAKSFQQTAAVLEHIRMEAANPTVTIGASTAVASLWLMPRIGAFWREYPDIRLNHRIADDENELRQADVQLLIRYGEDDWPEQQSQRIFNDRIIPVCSPEFAAQYPGMTLEALPELPLIHLEGVDRAWTTWRAWFQAQGIDPPRLAGPKFNNYTIALQAAMDNAGVALGWEKLIEPHLLRRTLVPLTEAGMTAPGSFHLMWHRHRDLSDAARLLRGWLCHAASQLDGSGELS